MQVTCGRLAPIGRDRSPSYRPLLSWLVGWTG